jgi:hypothetical protein
MGECDELDAATRRGRRRRATEPIATAARYDRRRDRIVVSLDSGLELAFPPRIAQGLEKAAPAELSSIEISPSGFGIHFPNLDAHLHLPALLEGIFGSRKWMAARLGAAGGRARSAAKSAAARVNGQRGGRPRRVARRNETALPDAFADHCARADSDPSFALISRPR